MPVQPEYAQLNEPEQFVYIVDDDAVLRDALTREFESAGLKVQPFPSAEDFLAAWNKTLRGCLVLDIRMPGISGLEMHDRLIAMHATLPVIFITASGNVAMAVSALKKGALDFIEKPFDNREMVKLVRAALTSEQKQFEQRRQEADAKQRIALLTPREREVLELIVLGRLNKQIADELRISIKTVEVHRARIMEKMGVNSLAELVQHVMRSALKAI